MIRGGGSAPFHAGCNENYFRLVFVRDAGLVEI